MKGQRTDTDAIVPHSPFGIGISDLVFTFLAVVLFVTLGGDGMLDDPGLGWHLRTADVMWESGEFVVSDEFCFPTEGRPWLAEAWLSDILLRLAYGWGGMNGLAAFSSIFFAFTIRCLYRRMISEGIPWLVAGIWSYLAALGISPAIVTRPNMFTLLFLMWVCQICEHFHSGRISKAKTIWLLPIFIVWPNLHAGFLAGIAVLAVACATECFLAVFQSEDIARRQSWERARWLSVLGIGVLLATLCNPNLWHLHIASIAALTDPFLQSKTTTEWLPPDFTKDGWYRIELIVLLFPFLGVLCNRRANLMSLVLSVMWLHFALTSARYAPLFVIVVVPTLAYMTCGIEILQKWANRIIGLWSEDIRAWLSRSGRENSVGTTSLACAAALFFFSPWFGTVAGHDQNNIPSNSLNRFLAISMSERTFHSIDWGGYLLWHGWNLDPRFKTFIDDRSFFHGRQRNIEYYNIMNGGTGWEASLQQYKINMVCIPIDAPLALKLSRKDNWQTLFQDSTLIVFQRRQK